MSLAIRNKTGHKQIFHLLWFLKLWVNIGKAMIQIPNIPYIQFQSPSHNFPSPLTCQQNTQEISFISGPLLPTQVLIPPEPQVASVHALLFQSGSQSHGVTCPTWLLLLSPRDSFVLSVLFHTIKLVFQPTRRLSWTSTATWNNYFFP